MTRQLKPWDEYVAEAEQGREPLELPMPDGNPILIHFPTGQQIEDLESAATTADAIRAIFGADGDRILTLFRKHNYDVLENIINDIKKEFGLGGPLLGNRQTSSR